MIVGAAWLAAERRTIAWLILASIGAPLVAALISAMSIAAEALRVGESVPSAVRESGAPFVIVLGIGVSVSVRLFPAVLLLALAWPSLAARFPALERDWRGVAISTLVLSLVASAAGLPLAAWLSGEEDLSGGGAHIRLLIAFSSLFSLLLPRVSLRSLRPGLLTRSPLPG